ncbi:hypothetical protein NIES2119_08140 [[Phormidium ambiguum] IAM M-71]|uniref:DUF1830 domain-containing protein n=1 Tax=[Phormidium ambiguum] IAM M-71 TaxID=454136 RepID=A0A1U7IPA2_9CYAN|nr:DUF1830 domain-containing protein [Phormidium ambiguum]OKH39090.1 hypothetical protein NIES2119_08140 [Phormidium ambiguum IAM M-71]
MIETCESSLATSVEEVLCFYTNASTEIQIIRIENTQNIKLERIVFPSEKLLFVGESKAQLEIYTGSKGKEMLFDTIPCASLKLKN